MKCVLTLVSAPAGFGKTTLLAQWLSASHLPSAWVSLESEDNEPARFLSILIAALQQLDPQLGTNALARLHSLPPSPAPPPETIGALLVTDLYHQQAPRDFVLVLDDYHVITSEVLHHALAYLIEHAPPHLHLTIATRSDPSLPLARLRVRGQLCQVRAAQLQFQAEETRAFFRLVTRLNLSFEESSVLQSKTEGWIAGLQLAALSLQDRADVLRTRLQREKGIDEWTSLYIRASMWYEYNGMQVEAVEAALAAGDFQRAGRLIDEPLSHSLLMKQQDVRRLNYWFERFPKEWLFTQAFLCLVYAWSLFYSETPDAYEGPLAVAEQIFQAEDNREGIGQVCTLRALAASLRGVDATLVIRYGEQALQLQPEESILERNVAASGLAKGYRMIGEVVAAKQVLTKNSHLQEHLGNMRSMLGDTIIYGDVLTMQGKLQQAFGIYSSILETVHGWGNGFTIRALIGLGNIARERNELEAAEAYLEQAFTIASTTREKVLQTRALSLRARVIEARGEAERTEEAWTSAVMLAQECYAAELVEQVQAYQVRYWLRQGQMDAVTQWQQTSCFSPAAPVNYQQEILALTLARVLITQGAAAEALRLLERWHAHARTQGRTESDIEILILSALTQQVQGKREQAVQLLQQALILAAPEGYMRLFVDEGIPMIALLSPVLSRWKGKAETESVQKMLLVLQATQGPLPLVASHREPLIEPLSPREYRVLRGLAAGLSNTEIAAELVVSINTIKSQVQSIYRKFNVTTRQEAVAVARYWRLL